jgi:hypothetical protein
MTLNVQAIKMNTPQNSAKNTEFSHDFKNSTHSSNPSFGSKHGLIDAFNFIEKPVNKLIEKFPNNMNINQEWLINVIKRIGGFSTPENRFIMGVTALSTQPFIDLNNKDVDEKTRIVSCARTIAKIIAGTLVGVAVRSACIRSIKYMTRTPEELAKIGKKATKWNTILIPDKIKNPVTGKLDKPLSEKDFGDAFRFVKKHRESLGSVIALGAMLITNFALDVPITKFLTNKLADRFTKSRQKESDAKGGS